ncbi:hypothetical protein QBC46DRAFT_368262 [Diplogelasinospora grovesii]|uniref:FluG domain-containing protein n=1 Tax=Diplogelasinospora grovesii TaxID=303347 RepID=A0AAN6RYA5_9PEZI|nr:hypothetical protein QBC46DRAFT_368262 [Diplogelasinospora grovesii]
MAPTRGHGGRSRAVPAVPAVPTRPPPLSAPQRAALRDQARRRRFFKPRRADGTRHNTAGILRKWKRYCEFSNLGAWREAVEKADKATAMDFIDYICDNYNIKSEGSSWEYFRQYQQLYTDVTSRYMDRNDCREIKKFHDTVVVTRFELRPPNVDGKPVVGTDGVLALLIFNIAYDRSVFPGESHRIHLAGIYETTGRGRPKALCYEDILLMIIRHPETGKDVPAIMIKFIHHKGADNKPKHLALRNNAFDVWSLTGASRVFRIKNLGPVKCTPLRWKESMLKIPVFRRFERAILSPDRPLPYGKLRDDLARQSLDAGNEEPIVPRAFRRLAANSVNGKAPDAVRDQAMRHNPRWATFNSAYINEMIQFDVQNAVLNEPSEDGLIRFWSHMSLMSDPRAASDMVPDEVWQDMPPRPDIVDLELRRAALKAGQFRIQGRDDEEEIRDLGRQIRNKQAQRRKDVKTGYRRYYFRNRPTWDIKKQFNEAEEEAEEEAAEEEEEYVAPAIELHIPERAELAEILVNQREGLSDKELLELRIRAADLMTALSHKRETAKRRRIRQKAQSHEERTFSYCRAAVMNDHFDSEHLGEMEKMERDNLIFCNHLKCKDEGVKLKHLDHFRSHIAQVHNVQLRSSWVAALNSWGRPVL